MAQHLESGLVVELSEGAPAPSEEGVPGIPAGRYLEGGELGRGGMGRVRAAFDPLLRRTVAMKQAREDDPAAQALLLAEARITASLDHPGIITVLDVCRGPDGAVSYAMRVVEGATFAEVVEDPHRPLTEVVRLLLAATQAIAYAHDRGVVHRDLSPRNVRIGAHDEVVVMDWGLAATVAEASAGGVRCGTPGYAAPELQRGEPAAMSSDVYSLGALLELALARKPPRPRELVSVVARCRAPQPHLRYRNAGEVADDLRAWLDGRRVQAHPERPWSRAMRMVRRHPVAVAATLLAALTVSVVAGAMSQVAARATAEALAASRSLLVRTARDAALADDASTALEVARQLEAIAPADPHARGVRAAFASMAPVTVQRLPAMPCEVLDERDGARLEACAGRPRLVRGTQVEEIPAAVPVSQGSLALGPERIVLFSVRSAGGTVLTLTSDAGLSTVELEGGLTRVDTSGARPGVVVASTSTAVLVGAEGPPRLVPACPYGSPGRFAIAGDGPGEAWVMCGSTLTHVVDGGATPLAPVDPSAPRLKGPITAARVDERTIAVGTVEGELGLMDLSTGAVSVAVEAPVGPVRDVAAVPGRPLVAVLGRDGAALWRTDLASWEHLAREDFVSVRTRGDAVIVTATDHREVWTLPPRLPWHRAVWPTGLTTVDMSADGATVAIGGSDGVVRLVNVATGSQRRLRRVDPGVIKQVSFSGDGRWLATATAGPRGLQVWNVSDGAPVLGPWSEHQGSLRAVGFVGPSVILAFAYGTTALLYDLSTGTAPTTVTLPGAHLAAVAFDGPRHRALILMQEGVVFEVGMHGVTRRFDAVGARTLAVDTAGHVIVAMDSEVRRVDDEGTVLERRVAPSRRVVAITAAGDLWATGHADGSVNLLWPDGSASSVLAHRVRAGALALSPRGDRLASVGWDGVARLLVPTPRSLPGYGAQNR